MNPQTVFPTGLVEWLPVADAATGNIIKRFRFLQTARNLAPELSGNGRLVCASGRS